MQPYRSGALAGQFVRVVDNGRGIPVETTAVQGQLGGRDCDDHAPRRRQVRHEGYEVSGGLHGVGASVVNALSSRLVLEVDRDGRTYRQEYAVEKGARRRGQARRAAGQAPHGRGFERGHTGTTIMFWPDPEAFEEIEFSAATVTERFQVMAFLNRGLTISSPTSGRATRTSTFRNDAGIVDFVRHLNHAKEPLFADVGSFTDSGPEGEVEVAWQWNTGYHEGLHSYANGISTTEAGCTPKASTRADPGDQPLHEGSESAEGQGPDLPGRRRARRAHRDLSVRRRSAVRRPDQGQARQHRDAFAGGARHQRAFRPLARGAPQPGEGDRRQGVERGTGAQRGQAGARADEAQDRARRCGHARQARRLRHEIRDNTELFIVEGDSPVGPHTTSTI